MSNTAEKYAPLILEGLTYALLAVCRLKLTNEDCWIHYYLRDKSGLKDYIIWSKIFYEYTTSILPR
jgi:hypothetical protein